MHHIVNAGCEYSGEPLNLDKFALKSFSHIPAAVRSHMSSSYSKCYLATKALLASFLRAGRIQRTGCYTKRTQQGHEHGPFLLFLLNSTVSFPTQRFPIISAHFWPRCQNITQWGWPEGLISFNENWAQSPFPSSTVLHRWLSKKCGYERKVARVWSESDSSRFNCRWPMKC